MSDVEADFQEALCDDVGLAAIISDRVYPSVIPEAPAENPTAYIPCVTYQRIHTGTVQSLGPNNIVAQKPIFQLMCWDTTDDGVRALQSALTVALLGCGYCVTLMDERSMRDPDTALWRRDIDAALLA